MNWIREHFSGMQTTDVNREVTDQVFQVKNNQLHLSRMVEWQFNNLNPPLKKCWVRANAPSWSIPMWWNLP